MLLNWREDRVVLIKYLPSRLVTITVGHHLYKAFKGRHLYSGDDSVRSFGSLQSFSSQVPSTNPSHPHFPFSPGFEFGSAAWRRYHHVDKSQSLILFSIISISLSSEISVVTHSFGFFTGIAVGAMILRDTEETVRESY